MRRRRPESGFTLPELLIVLVVMGLLATLAVVALGGNNAQGDIAVCQADGSTLQTAMNDFLLNHHGSVVTSKQNETTFVGSGGLQAWPSGNGFAFSMVKGVLSLSVEGGPAIAYTGASDCQAIATSGVAAPPVWALSAPGQLSEINTATATVSTSVSIPTNSVSSVAPSSTGDLWVTSPTGNTVTAVNPTTGTVNATIPVGTNPTSVSSGGSSVWVANSGSNTVSQIAPTTNQVVNTVPVGTNPVAISSDPADTWTANSGSDNVTEIDNRDGHVVRNIPTDGPPEGVFSDGYHVWVTTRPNGPSSPGDLEEFDASTGALIGTPLQVGDGCGAVTADGKYISVTNSTSGTVDRIDESNRSIIRSTSVGSGDNSVHDDGVHTWIGNSSNGDVVEVNDNNGGINARFGLRGNGVYGITS